MSFWASRWLKQKEPPNIINCRLLIARRENTSQDRSCLDFYYRGHRILIFVKNPSSFSHLRWKVLYQPAMCWGTLARSGRRGTTSPGHPGGILSQFSCELQLAFHEHTSAGVTHSGECCRLQLDSALFSWGLLVDSMHSDQCELYFSFVFIIFTAFLLNGERSYCRFGFEMVIELAINPSSLEFVQWSRDCLRNICFSSSCSQH